MSKIQKLLIATYLPLSVISKFYKLGDLCKIIKLGNYKNDDILRNIPDFITLCSTGNLEMVKISLKAGHYLSTEGLKWAVEAGHLKVVQYLCEKSMVPNCEICFLAAYKGHLDILKYFSENNILRVGEYDICWGTKKDKFYTYHDYQKYLTQYNLKPILEYPILEWCASGGNLETLKFLISLGLIPSEKTLNIAGKFGYLPIVDYLIRTGVTPTFSTLILAYNNNKIEVVTYLQKLNEYYKKNLLF